MSPQHPNRYVLEVHQPNAGRWIIAAILRRQRYAGRVMRRAIAETGAQCRLVPMRDREVVGYVVKGLAP